jgi:predicted amidophosphoribosyltransferase
MWNCSNCGKRVDDVFAICWNCQTAQDGTLPEANNASQAKVSSEKVSVCSNCAATLDADASFCPSCRKPVSDNASFNCSKCGKPVSVDAKYCKYCAADLTQSVAFPANLSKQKLGEDNSSYTIKVGILVSIGSAVLYFWSRSYVNDLGNTVRAGVSNMIGETDRTFSLAQSAMNLGMLGILLGVGLVLLGLYRRQS